ncbi:hypothetical protein HPB52_004975 [Rhipicephalus sanguineus]|uniref:Uncharacterized protein n=1 Tax=Rhipicephalus sanguineus TaxID=34632 RepID=A0A9D4PVH3_RHISA|nr:hypothetical protein HPB52_004975 [Rhipicephalus sanguineus]
MGDEHSARLSVYAEKLDADAKQRYTDKAALSGGVDPLILTSEEASFDIALVPEVELSDIKEYLVHASSFVTHEQLKAKKSLEEWCLKMGDLASDPVRLGFKEMPQRRAGVGFPGVLFVLKGTTPCRRNPCVVGFVAEPLEFDAATLRLPTSSRPVTAPQPRLRH